MTIIEIAGETFPLADLAPETKPDEARQLLASIGYELTWYVGCNRLYGTVNKIKPAGRT
jgi:hypothetical protein